MLIQYNLVPVLKDGRQTAVTALTAVLPWFLVIFCSVLCCTLLWLYGAVLHSDCDAFVHLNLRKEVFLP